ncbi:helix-turn-helix transcriptional regulator [Rhizorhabdus sp.]|jgi:DNA-binding CsgD family transcriptional regulator|uniref:helix-turn-helix transcriptional regulator n=1 Tax=Rhizorhabdus sp. TaxID=1968843 RepID=UPI0035ADFECF
MPRARRAQLHRRTIATTLVVALQALATMLFLLDLLGDVAAEGWSTHLAVEAAAAAALVAGVVAGALQIRALIERARQDDLAVALARGTVAALVRLRFGEWRLTPAEADVALFALKGADVAEIARLRGAAEGTVRAQLSRIYAKAGVGGQSALVAFFLDDLLDPEPHSAEKDGIA